MLIIFTGNGKGKTTAALGQALRSIGDGKRVLMVQFIKGPWKSGEDVSHKKFLPRFKIVKKGLGFVGIGGDPYPREAHEAAARDALEYAQKEVTKKTWDMLILDEVWNALGLKLISEKDIAEFLPIALSNVEHLIATGRGCPTSFMRQADLVTEMREIKHPFASGKVGQKGVEF